MQLKMHLLIALALFAAVVPVAVSANEGMYVGEWNQNTGITLWVQEDTYIGEVCDYGGQVTGGSIPELEIAFFNTEYGRMASPIAQPKSDGSFEKAFWFKVRDMPPGDTYIVAYPRDASRILGDQMYQLGRPDFISQLEENQIPYAVQMFTLNQQRIDLKTNGPDPAWYVPPELLEKPDWAINSTFPSTTPTAEPTTEIMMKSQELPTVLLSTTPIPDQEIEQLQTEIDTLKQQVADQQTQINEQKSWLDIILGFLGLA